MSDLASPWPKLLIIDAVVEDRLGLRDALVAARFEVIDVSSGKEGRACMAQQAFDLVILDHDLPNEDGMSLVREICANNDQPLVITSARSRLVSRIVGLELGADDFIAKPYDQDEFVARIRAILRRSLRSKAAELDRVLKDKAVQSSIYRFDDFTVDCTKREARRENGDLADLTATEFDLLVVFLRNAHRPLSRLFLIERLGKTKEVSSIRAIDGLVVKLRRKIQSGPKHPDPIKTIRGAGYLFASQISTAV